MSSSASAPIDAAPVWGPVISVLVLVLANLLTYAANERSALFRHVMRLGARPLLFISNRAAGISKQARPLSYWAWDLVDPAELTHSHCLATPLLLALHAATFLYFVLTVLVDVVIEFYGCCVSQGCVRGGGYAEWMTFLTNWSISLLGIAGLVAFINTARQLNRQRRRQRQLTTSPCAPDDAPQQQMQMQQPHSHTERQQGASSKSLPTHVPEQQQAGDGKGRGTHSSSQSVLPTSSCCDKIRPTDNSGGSAAADAAVVSPSPAPDAAPGAAQTSLQHHAAAKAPHQGAASAGSSHDGAASCCFGGGRSGSDASTNDAGPADTVVIVGGSGSDGSPGSDGSARQRLLLQQWDALNCLHCLLMEVATSAAFFVTFWYWVGVVSIAEAGFAISGGTLMAHAGNVVVALLQVVLTRLPIVSYHFQVLLWYASAYSVFLWIYGGASGIWRYGLDVQQPKPAAAFCIIPAVTFVMFMIWFLAAKVREGVLCAAHKRAMHHRQHQRRKQQAQAQAQAQA